jgi:hypothetical protein
MEVNQMSGGTATYAIKKALEMPTVLMELVRDSSAIGQQPLGMKSPVPQPPEIAIGTGKGQHIDLVA